MSESKNCTGANFSVYESGAKKDWPDHVVKLPGIEIPGKKFINEMVDMSGCEISINSLLPGSGMPFYHTHQENEEVYIFIEGKGQMMVDDEVIDVQEGSIVRIAPEGVRTWRNNSDAPLLYIVIQTKKGSLNKTGVSDGVVPEREVSWAA